MSSYSNYVHPQDTKLNPQLQPNTPQFPYPYGGTHHSPTPQPINLSGETFNWREQLAVGDLLLNQFRTIRQELSVINPDERRNIAKECGYPVGTPSIETYQNLYDTEGIATRVVEVMPKESWKVKPIIYEVEDPETETPFEKSFRELPRLLSDEENFHTYDEDETGANPGNPIWEVCERADIQSGIGQYGVILIGIDDGKDLSTPVDGYEDGNGIGYPLSPLRIAKLLQKSKGEQPFKTTEPERNLLYLSVFPETMAVISTFEENLASPRFGKPKTYSITMSDPKLSSVGSTPKQHTLEVHWSRVIHVSDNIGTSPIFGVPRQQPVLRRLLDLQKLYGGSAEMYWKGAFFGLSIETIPQLGGNVKIDQAALKSMMENYSNGLQRYLAFTGMNAKTLAPQVVDPTQQIQVQIDAICITKGIPKRIFMGSERGELASSQDDVAWNERIEERRNNYLTPRMVVPLVNRLIGMKVLARPSKSYRCYWPDCSALSDVEKANIAVQYSIALANFMSSGSEAAVPKDVFLNKFLHMPEKEIIQMLEKAKENMKLKEDEEIASTKKKMSAGIIADPTKPKEVVKPNKPSGSNGARQAPRGGIAKGDTK